MIEIENLLIDSKSNDLSRSVDNLFRAKLQKFDKQKCLSSPVPRSESSTATPMRFLQSNTLLYLTSQDHARNLLIINIDKMLSPAKVQKYKEKLEEERAKILAELKKHEGPQDFGSDVDVDEEADEAEEFGNQLAVQQALKDRVSEIDVALGKMASGEYGVCEKCGKEIGENLLEAVPESHLCVDCKKKFPGAN